MALTNVWIASFFGPPPAAIGATPVWIAPNDGTVPSAVQSVIAGYFTAVAGASPVWIAGFFAPPPAAIGATPICISGWSGSGGGGGAATSVWSASDAAANSMTLSNGGLTVSNGAVLDRTIRGSISKASGKMYVEFAAVVSGGNPIQGFADITFPATAALGTANYSGGIYYGNNPVSAGFVSNYTVMSVGAATGSTVQLAIDFASGNIWVGLNNTWANGSNPATGTLPILSFTPATVGALFPALKIQQANESWTLQPTPASQKYLPPPGFQAWDGGPVTPPASSVWSAADAAANSMTLSNGGLTLSGNTPGAWETVRNTISKTSGKLYVEFYVTAENHAQIFGLANASFNVAPVNSYLGSQANSGGIGTDTGGVIAGSGFTVNYTTTSTLVVNDVWAMAVDFTAGSIWIAKNNVWQNSSNPATGSLPIMSFVPATVGALFAAVSIFQTLTVTLQPTPASQKYLPPPGFQAWDGGPVTPPASSVWSASDAAANAMTLSNGGLTVTSNPAGGAWLSARTTIGKTAGKLYIEYLCVANSSDPHTAFGLASSSFLINSYLGTSTYSAGIDPGQTYAVGSAGFTKNYDPPGFANPVTNDVWALAVDFTAGSIWIAQNNVWVNASNPATGTLPIISFTSATVGALFAGLSTYAANGVWTLQPTAAAQKYLPPPGFQAWDGGPVTPPASSVWSASDAAANAMTLSNGGLTVTPQSAAGWRSIRSSIGKTSGKLYIELSNSVAATDWQFAIGLADATFPAGSQLAATPYSCEIVVATATNVSAGFTSNYTSSLPDWQPAAGVVFAIAVDFTAGSIWIADNNVWSNSSNPATGTLPIVSFVPATVGALFAAMSFNGPNHGVWTLQPTAASQKYAPPSGFTPWG